MRLWTLCVQHIERRVTYSPSRERPGIEADLHARPRFPQEITKFVDEWIRWRHQQHLELRGKEKPTSP
jgi:hypothetical protein